LIIDKMLSMRPFGYRRSCLAAGRENDPRWVPHGTDTWRYEASVPHSKDTTCRSAGTARTNLTTSTSHQHHFNTMRQSMLSRATIPLVSAARETEMNQQRQQSQSGRPIQQLSAGCSLSQGYGNTFTLVGHSESRLTQDGDCRYRLALHFRVRAVCTVALHTVILYTDKSVTFHKLQVRMHGESFVTMGCEL
jgi:hypothetical protein